MSEKAITSILLGKTVYIIDDDGYVFGPSGGALFCGECAKKYNLEPNKDSDKLLEIGAQFVANDEFSIKCPHCGKVATDEFENLRRLKLII